MAPYNTAQAKVIENQAMSSMCFISQWGLLQESNLWNHSILLISNMGVYNIKEIVIFPPCICAVYSIEHLYLPVEDSSSNGDKVGEDTEICHIWRP